MVQRRITHLLILLTVCVGCGRQESHFVEVKQIAVDTSAAEEQLDISPLLDLDRVEIVQLETNDDALVSLKGGVKMAGGRIFIGDNTTQRISLFNRDGSFTRNIGMRGRGPGEYVRLGSYATVRDSVYVQDAAQDKIVVYPIEGTGYREIHPHTPIYYVDMFSGGEDYLYFVTNYASTGQRSANLVGMDIKSGRMSYLIPFDPKIEEFGLAWGLNKYSSSHGDGTLVIYGRNDTIYRVNGGDVRAEYVMRYTRNTIPNSLLRQEASSAFLSALEDGYNTGLDRIHNTTEYFFAEFAEGSKDIYTLIHDKRNNLTRLGKSLVIEDMGGLQVLDFWTTKDDELVLGFEAFILKTLWEHNLSESEFTNAALKRSIREAAQSSLDDDNPILLIIKLK